MSAGIGDPRIAWQTLLDRAESPRGGVRGGRLMDLGSAPLLALALAATWLVVNPRSPDLAAQVYRVDLFRRVGFSLWDNNWYGGHHLPGYSLVFPPLATLVGLRVLGATAVVVSSALFARLASRHFGPGIRVAAALFAVGACGDLWIGRLTFALGVSVGLAAILAQTKDRRVAAAVLGVVCAATSPVAGLFLVLAAVAQGIAGRAARPVAGLTLAPLAVVLALTALFPEGGVQPFAASSFAAAFGVSVAFVLLMPRTQRALRVGGVLYVAAVVLSLVAVTPMGSNVVRLGVLFAGPLVLCSLTAFARGRLTTAATLAIITAGIASTAWTVNGPLTQSLRASNDPSVRAAFYRPVKRFLARVGTGPARVEVPFSQAHWESAYLADSVPLARGWERQLDVKYNAIFDGALTAAAYRHWLVANAVRYVALSDAPLDGSSIREATLIRGGLPFLRPVLRSTHWRVYAVAGHEPLASGPGHLTLLAHDHFALRAAAPGRFVVRVRYTPYWSVTAGAACVTHTRRGWTAVTATAPGGVVVAARWSVQAALRADRHCPAPPNSPAP